MMMRRSTRAVSVAIPLALALTCVSPHLRAAAQPSIETASADEQKVARAAYAEGVEAFERRDYAHALERFDAADTAVSSPNVKLMRARCLAQLDRPAEAHAMYRATVDEAEASGEARYQASATAAAEEAVALEANIALLTLTLSDETGRAVLEINGQVLPPSQWSKAVPLPPGPVSVTLTGPQGQQDHAERVLTAGTRSTLDLAIAIAPLPVAAPTTFVPAPLTKAPAESDGLPVLPIALGAAGGVALGAFAVFGSMSNAELDELERGCPSREACAPELADAASRGSTYQTIANISLGAGLVLLATGTTLFVLDLSSDELQVALTPSGAQLRGSL